MMFKNLILSVLLSNCWLISFCQENTFGMKGGLNISTIGGDAIGLEPKAGLHAGFFLRRIYNETFSIQPELLYSRQGAQVQALKAIKFHYDYLNMPVMINAHLSEQFYVQGGPQVGVLLAAKSSDDNQSQDLKDQLTKWDLSISGGLGFNFGRTELGLRYTFGVTDTAKVGRGTSPNNVLQISLSYLFP